MVSYAASNWKNSCTSSISSLRQSSPISCKEGNNAAYSRRRIDGNWEHSHDTYVSGRGFTYGHWTLLRTNFSCWGSRESFRFVVRFGQLILFRQHRSEHKMEEAYKLKPATAIPSNLIVNYLPTSINSDEALKALFSPFGGVESCKLMINKHSGESKIQRPFCSAI